MAVGYDRSSNLPAFFRLIALATLPMLAGCTAIQAQSRVDPQTVAYYAPGDFDGVGKSTGATAKCPRKIAGDTNAGAMNLDCFKFPKIDDKKSNDTAYGQALQHPDQRKRLGEILLGRSDTICLLELGRLTANEAAVNSSLSILTTAFSATAAIVDGDLAKRIFAGLANTANGSRSAVDAEVYRNTLAPVVVRAIEGERAAMKLKIEANLSLPDYNVDQMIREINDYHHACSFYHGLSLVVKAADRAAFEQSDTSRAISMNLEDIALRLDIAKNARAKSGISDGEKAALDAQITTLYQLQTKLLSDRVALTGSAPAPAASPTSTSTPTPAPTETKTTTPAATTTKAGS